MKIVVAGIFCSIIVVIILTSLNFFGYLKIDIFQQSLSGLFPASKQTVKTISEAGFVSFRLVDIRLLLNQLEKYQFWEKYDSINYSLGGVITDKSLLYIVLTDKQDSSDRYITVFRSTDGKVYAAEGVGTRDNNLSILLFLSPEMLTTDNEDLLNKRVNAMLFRLIYSITNAKQKDLSVYDEELMKEYEGLFSSGERFVEIIR